MEVSNNIFEEMTQYTNIHDNKPHRKKEREREKSGMWFECRKCVKANQAGKKKGERRFIDIQNN